MNPLTVLFAGLLCLTSAELSPAPSTSPATTQATAPIVAVSFQMTYPPVNEKETDRLGVGMWNDGTIVWSANEKGVGRPYRKATIESSRLEKLMKDLDEAEFFTRDKEILKHSTYPPDAAIHVIAVDTEQQRQRLVSWRNPPQSESTKYNEIFSKAEKLIREAVPKEGEAVEDVDPRVYRIGWKRR